MTVGMSAPCVLQILFKQGSIGYRVTDAQLSFVILGIEPRALCMLLGMCSTTKYILSPLFPFHFVCVYLELANSGRLAGQ